MDWRTDADRPEVVRATADLWNNGHPAEQPSGFAKPVLILTGSDDPIITPGVAATVVARFDPAKTTATEIEKSSHWPHIEQPSVVAAQISCFLVRNLTAEAADADARHG